MVREGTQGTIIAIGSILDLAMEATEKLDVKELYCMNLCPFDSHALQQEIIEFIP
jgi:transketolase C-terminal domain/subunit